MFFCATVFSERLRELTVEAKYIAHSLRESDAGFSLGIRDQRILCLLRTQNSPANVR